MMIGVFSIIAGLMILVSGIMYATGRLSGSYKFSRRKTNFRRNTGELMAGTGMMLITWGAWPGSEEHWLVTVLIIWSVLAAFDIGYTAGMHRKQKTDTI